MGTKYRRTITMTPITTPSHHAESIPRRFRIAHTGRAAPKRRAIRYLGRQIADFPGTEIVSRMLHPGRCKPCLAIRNSAAQRQRRVAAKYGDTNGDILAAQPADDGIARAAVIQQMIQDYGFCPSNTLILQEVWSDMPTETLERMLKPSVKTLLEVRNTCNKCGGHLPIELDNHHVQAAFKAAYARERRS